MLKIIVALIAAAFSAAAAADTGSWQAAETEHFVIYSKSPRDRVEKLALDLETYDKLMHMATGTPPDPDIVKVRIYEVENTSEVERALGLNNSGIAGFYEGNSLGPFLVTPRTIDVETSPDFTASLVLHHEYAHHFMLQYFPSVYPNWYVEGFAELIGSSKRMKDGRIGYGMPATHRGHDIAADWAPLQDLLVKEKVTYLDTYGQGWALTHFFTFDSERSKQFRAYLDGLRDGKSLKEAAKVFGDLSALNRDARRYVTAGSFGYRPVSVQVAQPVVRSTRPMTAAEIALIPEVVAFRDEPLDEIKKNGDREQELRLRRANLARIREKAALYPSDAFALLFLAEAEYSAGNYTDAEAAADRLLAIDPNNVRGMARKSILLARRSAQLQGAARAAGIAEARQMALKANKLSPNEALPYLAFYESFHLAGETPTAAAVLGLKEAMRMQPLSVVPRTLFVDELARDGFVEQAIDSLMPIANSPHDSPRRQAAREKLAKLQAELVAKRQGATASD